MKRVAETCIDPRIEDVEPDHLAGLRIDELEPAAIRPQPELLRHEVRRRVDAGLPDAEHRAAVAIGIVLERPTPEPPQSLEAGREFERHADAWEIVELRAARPPRDDGSRRPVRRDLDVVAVLDQLVGRHPFEPERLPPLQCVAAVPRPRPQFGHQLEPVVVHRRPQHTQLRPEPHPEKSLDCRAERHESRHFTGWGALRTGEVAGGRGGRGGVGPRRRGGRRGPRGWRGVGSSGW